MLRIIFCVLLLVHLACASSYSYNCVVDGTLTVAGKQILPLAAGDGTALLNNGTNVVVSTSGANLASAGGTSLVADGTGPSLSILGLSAGSGIKLYADNSSATISADVNLTSAGGVSLVASPVGPNLSILGLSPGSGIKLYSGASTVTVSADVNLTSAGGISLVSSPVGPSLAVLGLSPGSGIKMSASASSVTVSADVNLTSAGGVSLVSTPTGPSLAVLGLAQGNGIVLTPSPTTVTVASTTSTYFIKANVALAANVATNIFAVTPAVSTTYGFQLTLYGTDGAGTINVAVLAEGTGSSVAGTIGCGYFNRFGTGGSSTGANTFAAASFNINTAQTVATSVNNAGAGVLFLGCYLTTSANAFTTLRVQTTATAASTLYPGSSMVITTNPLTN